MNCCNEYGECRQGRDCPVRTEMCIQRNETLKNKFVDFWTMLVVKVMFYLNVLR